MPFYGQVLMTGARNFITFVIGSKNALLHEIYFTDSITSFVVNVFTRKHVYSGVYTNNTHIHNDYYWLKEMTRKRKKILLLLLRVFKYRSNTKI